MHNHHKTRPFPLRARLEEAINLAKSGHKAEAGEILRRIVALQPVNQAAWLWLSAVSTDQAEVEMALAQAKKIDPNHPSLPRAEQWMVHRFSPVEPTKKSPVIKTPPHPVSTSTPSKNLLGMFNSLALGLAILSALIGLLVLLLGLFWEVNASAQPDDARQQVKLNNTVTAVEKVDESYLTQLDTAWAAQNWPQAITILDKAYAQQQDSQSIKTKLTQAYLQNGVALRKRGFIEDAVVNFEAALQVEPDQNDAQQQIHLASAYLAGVQHYQAGRWQIAITELETVWIADDTYINVKDLLYSAHYNLALARHAAGELQQAKESLEAAVTLRPDLSDPRQYIADIEFVMAPQTPLTPLEEPVPVEDKVIMVGIAEQRMAVYEGDEQVFDFIVSTGEPGRATAIGEFEVLNKIDVAYASTWNLDMPYWMGIYWAGSLQNGIHSLPIVKHTGYKLWDGYLGQRVSYGCVILSDEDAAALYNWAEVGTKVKIVPTLDP